MINRVTLVGNLGQDPEMRNTNSGMAVCNLSVATTHRAKDRDGNYQDQVEWHRVSVFGKTAENVNRYCRKGRQVYVEGRLQTRKWQDKDGRDRWSTEIVADVVKFLGRGEGQERTERGGGYGGNQGGGYGGGGSYGGTGGGAQMPSTDIPF
jgi:single-strand DNA-binding protein